MAEALADLLADAGTAARLPGARALARQAYAVHPGLRLLSGRSRNGDGDGSRPEAFDGLFANMPADAAAEAIALAFAEIALQRDSALLPVMPSVQLEVSRGRCDIAAEILSGECSFRGVELPSALVDALLRSPELLGVDPPTERSSPLRRLRAAVRRQEQAALASRLLDLIALSETNSSDTTGAERAERAERERKQVIRHLELGRPGAALLSAAAVLLQPWRTIPLRLELELARALAEVGFSDFWGPYAPLLRESTLPVSRVPAAPLLVLNSRLPRELRDFHARGTWADPEPRDHRRKNLALELRANLSGRLRNHPRAVRSQASIEAGDFVAAIEDLVAVHYLHRHPFSSALHEQVLGLAEGDIRSIPALREAYEPALAETADGGAEDARADDSALRVRRFRGVERLTALSTRSFGSFTGMFVPYATRLFQQAARYGFSDDEGIAAAEDAFLSGDAEQSLAGAIDACSARGLAPRGLLLSVIRTAETCNAGSVIEAAERALGRAGRDLPACSERVAARFDPDLHPHAHAAAWLHDVIEDCGITAHELTAAGIATEAVRAVSLLPRTRMPNPSTTTAASGRIPSRCR